ncbi:MAG TPA: FtsX-like permease family protein [Bryobacteraceae bacterium]|jgi:putative ABC transport system permease protein|nr:FtsX-like permease family protein [Bryobacteraceae bacterium]
MFRYLPLVTRNAWRNRRRTVLTILSVAASLSLLGILMAIYAAFYASDPPPEQALRLTVRNKVSLVFPMPEAYREKIKRIPGVREVMAQQWFGGVYKDNRPENLFARFAIEPEKIFIVRGEMKLPEEQKAAFQRERTACLIGRQLADKIHATLGDRITLQGDIFPVTLELTVRAIFDTRENNEVLYFNRKYLDESIKGALKGAVGMFTILAENADAVPRIAQAVDDEFRNSTTQTKTETERAFQLGFINALGNVKAFLVGVCGAVTFTVLLVSGNTMAMSVRERVREVGVMKTLGFTREAILGMILGESVVLAVVGAAIGLGIATGLCGLVRKAPGFVGQLKTLSIHPPVALACLGVAVVIGLISSAVPAWNASNTPIVEALRRND